MSPAPNTNPKRNTVEFWASRVQFWTNSAKEWREKLARAQAEDDHLEEIFCTISLQSSEVQITECAKQVERCTREQFDLVQVAA